MPEQVFAGFTSLEGGMDGGRSPSLISDNQVAFAGNVSFRGAFPKTRPPVANLLLTFDSDVTEDNFLGRFQGACFYEAEFGRNGIILSVGGRLFRIQIDRQNIVNEITPTMIIVTTAVFTVPALNGTVNVSVNSETLLEFNDTVYMDSGQYLITNRSLDSIEVQYLGGAANATVESGSSVLDSAQAVQIEYQTNPSTYDFVHLFQAENYVIALAGQHSPVIYDGAKARLAGIGEIPPGFIGIYIWGRIWIALPNRRSFVAGDIVYGPSGSFQLGKRDAILKFTENDFLNEGGTFSVPSNSGPITSFFSLATQDTSLGVGNLLVGTTNSVISVNTPVDRTTWKNLTYPIQTISLIDYGPQGPRWPASVNGDAWYRSLADFRSFIVARRGINVPGNTPMSREVAPILESDTQSLLFYGSAMLFDNKVFGTVSPVRQDNGVVHRGLANVNLDLLSSMKGKFPPSWEGIQTGLNILQLLKGPIDGQERAFALALNDDGGIELWELLSESAGGLYDVYQTREGINTSITRTAIDAWMDTKSYDSQSPFNLKNLYMGELYIDEIVDEVQVRVKFRPDQYPTWVDWQTITLCANVTQCTVNSPGAFSCTVWKTRQKQYAARIRIPRPPASCNSIAGVPLDLGYEFQFRLEWTGHCRIRRFRTRSNLRSQESEGACAATPVCTSFEACDEDWFDYNSRGD